MEEKQITKICSLIVFTVIISVTIMVVGKSITNITIANIDNESKIEVIKKETESKIKILDKEIEIEKIRQSNIDTAYNKAISDRIALWNANADDNGRVNNDIRDWVYNDYYKELDFIAERYRK